MSDKSIPLTPEIQAALDAITEYEGCSAGFCFVTGVRTGQHTNVNCRCHHDRSFVMLVVDLYRKIADSLAASSSHTSPPE